MNHLTTIWNKRDECSSGNCASNNGSQKRIVAGWPKKRATW